MNHEAKVTFIIPAYNVEKYLQEAVESVLAQTYRSWKIIIIDDCSTDRTFEVATELASQDNRIKVMRTVLPTGGPFIPRRVGIRAAQTEFIAPLDADDKIPPHYLQSLMDTLQDKGVDAVFPVLCRWDGTNTKVYDYPEIDAELLDKSIKGKEAVKYTLDGWRFQCGGGIIKRDLYLEGYSQMEYLRKIPFMDELLSRMLLYNADTVCMTPVPYLYRENPSSVTHSRAISSLGFEVNLRLIIFAREKYGDNSEEYLLAQRQNFHGMFEAMRLLNRPDYPAWDVKRGKAIVSVCRDAIDLERMKGNVSGKYYLLSLLPLWLCRWALRIIDRIMGK